ncbi:hypothetical protein ACFXPR_20980 [Nocardia tengchongensis]|uniref:hypothetical protein n=1 Tax=Nocardia tengchongensis TaxID=2055889 RepID=UPI00368F9EB8
MDPVTLIAAAVAAGAAAGAGETAKRAVADGYLALKALISRHYGVVDAEVIGVESEPGEPLRRQLLARQLEKAGAGQDPEVCAAAEQLLRVIANDAPDAARSAGVKLNRVEASGHIQISDIAVIDDGSTGVDVIDVRAAAIRISGVQVGRPGAMDPTQAPR